MAETVSPGFYALAESKADQSAQYHQEAFWDRSLTSKSDRSNGDDTFVTTSFALRRARLHLPPSLQACPSLP